MKFLENSLEKLARILSRQYNIEVVFQGQQACTDGKKIVLPYFKEITEELELDLNGYLDHEVGHVNFTTFPEIMHVINAYHKQLLNSVEDVRIERLMIQKYPGTKYHLDLLNEKLLGQLEQKWFTMPWSVRFLIAVSNVMTGRTLVEDAEVQKYLDLCEEEISKLNSCNSTKELRVLSEAIVKKLIKDLKDEDKKKEEEKQKGEKGEGEEGDESDDSDSSDSDSSDSKDGKEGKSGKSKESKEDKESKDSDSQGDKSSEKKETKKAKGEKGKPSKDKGDKLLTEKSDEAFDQYEIDVHRMINQMIEEKVAKEENEMDKTKRASYNYDYVSDNTAISIPYTTKFDRTHDYCGKNKNNTYGQLRNDVKPLVNTLKVNLERIFKSVENARWKTEREQGLVNARALSSLSANPNYRGVFKEMVKHETDKVAISILVDLSGSMSSSSSGGASKVETAKLAATAMSEALMALGMNFEVLGFNTGASNELYNYIRGSKDSLSRFNRTGETLEHHVFKDFNCTSLSGLTNMKADGANADGESVMWAAKRLALRTEKRKVLIVLSDGMPSCGGDGRILQSDLRVKLAQIAKFGIETVGIGIQTDAVKNFYKDYIVINNLKDLTTTSLKKLESILLKGIKR